MNSMIPCLPSGLAKNSKIMCIFVLFFGFSAILKVWLLLEIKWLDKPYTKAVKQDVFSQFSKVQHCCITIFKGRGYFDKA